MLPNLHARPQSSAGFTFIELFIIITMLAILATVGISIYSSQLRKQNLIGAASTVTGLLNQARVQSQTGDQGQWWQVSFATNPPSATINCVGCPANQGRKYSFPQSVTFNGTPPTPIIFQKIIGSTYHPNITTPTTNPLSVTLRSSTWQITITIPPQGPIKQNPIQG